MLLASAPREFRGAKPIELDRLGPRQINVETPVGQLIQITDTNEPLRLLQIADSGQSANAVLIPFDDNFSARVQTAQRLFHRMNGIGRRPAPPALSRKHRARLALLLRALDGKLSGTSHREIAAVLLDHQARTIPAIEWTNAALRKRINRIIVAAKAMADGGYVKLLRGDVERAKRFWKSSL